MHEPGAGIALWIFVIVIDCILKKILYIRKFLHGYLLNSVFMLFVAIALAYLMGTIGTEQRRVDRNCEYHFSGNVLSWEVRLCLFWSSWK